MTQVADYEDVMLGSMPEHVHLCGSCNEIMEEKSEKSTLCHRCGKRGWDVVFRCPRCGEEIIRFRQDKTDGPPCYSCD
jgi:primosomal protein N'